MHLTKFELTNGKIICDVIKKVDLKRKRVSLWNKGIWLKFADLTSAITIEERVSIKGMENVDELPKWRGLVEK